MRFTSRHAGSRPVDAQGRALLVQPLSINGLYKPVLQDPRIAHKVFKMCEQGRS
jgi:hypothetical protein